MTDHSGLRRAVYVFMLADALVLFPPCRWCGGIGGKEQALLRHMQRQVFSDLVTPKIGRSVLEMPQTCKMQAFLQRAACMQPGTSLHEQ